MHLRLRAVVLDLSSDGRIAVRQLLRARTGTVAIVATLALGISANTSMFTLTNAMLFKPPVAHHPEALLAISGGDATRAVSPLSYPDFVAIRQQAHAFSGVMGYAATDVALGGAVPERTRALLVSGNYFDVLGIRATVGRTFLSVEDATPATHPVVVIGYALWTRRFGADPHITDSTIIVNGSPFRVVGVAPRDFNGLEFDESAQMFVPVAMISVIMPTHTGLLTEERSQWLRTVARIAPGTTENRARSELATIARQFDVPTARPEQRKMFAATHMVGGLDPSNHAEIAPIMGLLTLVPLLVLLVACANAANMQLARGLSRRREFAVRRALGASRLRVVRQLLTESVLLSCVAGALGIVGSFWLTKGILLASSAPRFLEDLLVPDPRVMAATTALAMLSGVVFGLAPALAAASPVLTSALKDESGTVVLGKQRHRLRATLVVGQVTVSMVLVITAGLFLRSLDKALQVDPGFDVRHTATASFDLGMQGYSPDARSAFQQDVLTRGGALPGVTSAALTSSLPLSGRMWNTDILAEGGKPDRDAISSGYASVSASYLSTMQISLLKGRDFSESDRDGAAAVVIVNETLARRLWPKGDAVGMRIRLDGSAEPLREVVGVAKDGHYDSLIETQRSFFYLPLSQYGSFESALTLVVRTTGQPFNTLSSLSAMFKALDANLPLYRVQTLNQSIARTVDKQRAAAALLGIFGALALLLAAFGMYAVTAQGIGLRRKEIGIRMSLGARTVDVLTLFVSEGLRYSLVGVALGVMVSAAISRVLASFLFGLTPTDAETFAAGALMLCLVSGVASYLPARRAARLDPLVAMRSD